MFPVLEKGRFLHVARLCMSLTDSKACWASTLRGVITEYIMKIAEVIYMSTGLGRNTNAAVFPLRTDTNQRIGKDVNKAFAYVRQNKIQATSLQHKLIDLIEQSFYSLCSFTLRYIVYNSHDGFNIALCVTHWRCRNANINLRTITLLLTYLYAHK